MASFYGRTAPKSNYRPRSGSVPDFEPIELSAAGVRSNAASAADTVSTSGIYGTLADNAPDQQAMAVGAAKNRMDERINIEKNMAKTAMAGMEAAKTVKLGEIEKEIYDEQAKVAKKGGQMGMIAGIAGPALKLLTGGIL